MDVTLLKVTALMGLYLGTLDVFQIHRNYTLDTETIANMYLHHILITFIMIGTFFYSKAMTKFHVITALLVLGLWIHNDGCLMTMWQNEKIPYSTQDYHDIHGTRETRAQNHFLIMIPAIAYDFYKLLH